MKVRLNAIPPLEGLDVDFLLPAEVLTAPSKWDRVDERFHLPLECKLHLELSNEDVFLRGEVKGLIHTICYRCGQDFEYPVNLPISVLCASRQGKLAGKKVKKIDGELHQDSDEGLVYFNGFELDLSEIIREQVFFSLPMRYLCSESCTGYTPDSPQPGP